MNVIRVFLTAVCAFAVVALPLTGKAADLESAAATTHVFFHDNSSYMNMKLHIHQPAPHAANFDLTVPKGKTSNKVLLVPTGAPIDFEIDTTYWRASYTLSSYAAKIDVFMDVRNGDLEADVPSVGGAKLNYRGKSRLR
jgi:hypothetical protein